MAGLSMHALGYVFNRIFTEVGNRGASYFGVSFICSVHGCKLILYQVVFTQTFGTFSHPLNMAWMSLACRNPEERALGMAIGIAGANIAGIWGAQIFRSVIVFLHTRDNLTCL